MFLVYLIFVRWMGDLRPSSRYSRKSTYANEIIDLSKKYKSILSNCRVLLWAETAAGLPGDRPAGRPGALAVPWPVTMARSTTVSASV